MKKQYNIFPDFSMLRQKAELKLKKKLSKSVSEISEIEILKLIPELEVYQIELELQNEELMIEKYASMDANELYNFAPLAYFRLSREGDIVTSNIRGAALLGKESINLKNNRFGFFVTDETKPSFNHFLKNIFIYKKPETCEICLLTKNKSSIYVQLNGIVSKNKDQCLVNAIDITERRLAEEALHESEEKYRSVIQSANDVIIISNENGIITTWNKVAERIFGYTALEMLGTPLTNIIPDQNSNLLMKDAESSDQKSIHPIKFKIFELYGIHKNGYQFPIELSLSEWETKNGKFFTDIIRDITERKHSEQLLIKSKEKAEEIAYLKSVFLANMSHEIRTPMNGVLGFAGLLKNHDLTDKERQEYIRIIEKSGKQMLNIINDIISISKIEAGKLKLTFSKTNINKQIEYIYTFFKPEVEQKNILLLKKTPLPDKEILIETDKEKLIAILTNLVKNAINFTTKGYVELGYSIKNGEKSNNPIELEFFVRDTGVGIPDEQKEIIFERFRQGSKLVIRNNEGAGLGLSISKAYVEMLGGKIWVESQTADHLTGKSGGSVFYFTLPYTEITKEKYTHIKTETHVTGENLKYANVHGLKILIVEDDMISKMLLIEKIRNLNCEILIAETGLEAIEICRKNPDIDLILMDIQMPDMDGYEATRQIRSFNKDVVIFAQTAYTLSTESEIAFAAGCNEYISKPIDNKIFTEYILKYFRKQSVKS